MLYIRWKAKSFSALANAMMGDNRKPWYDPSFTIAILVAFIAFGGQIGPGLLSIFSADTGDYCINVRPIPIEAVPYKQVFLSENIGNWPYITVAKESPQATVYVDDIQCIIKNYRHPVWLNVIEDCDVTIRFETPATEPPFEAKMFVHVNDPTKSIKCAPIIIQGIGGDGKKRNCTIYVQYKSPKDLVKEGAIQFQIGNYNESIELFDKSLEIDERYSSGWKSKGYVYAKACCVG